MKKLLFIIIILCSTVFPQCLGDVNEDYEINILDVVLGINIILEMVEYTEEQLTALDYNEDGNSNIVDLVMMVNGILYEELECEEEVNPGECPTSGQIYDCNGNCAPDSWVGDGFCDNGSYNFAGNDIFFNCDEFNNDEGDCDALGRTTQQRPYPNGRIKTN